VAIPPGLIAGLGQVAMHPKVQEFAGRLASDVYSKFMPSDLEIEEDETIASEATLEDVVERLDELPTKDELVTSFSFLQAELVRQNQKTRLFVVVGLAVQLAILVAAFVWVT